MKSRRRRLFSRRQKFIGRKNYEFGGNRYENFEKNNRFDFNGCLYDLFCSLRGGGKITAR